MKAVLALIVLQAACFPSERRLVWYGTVTQASQSSHSFDEARNPQNRPPIPHAAISMYLRIPLRDCGEVPSDARSHVVAETDDAGGFRILKHFPKRSEPQGTPVLLCVKADGYEDYSTQLFVKEVRDPTAGKYFNIAPRRRDADDNASQSVVTAP